MVGRNGAGKSTLLALLAGRVAPDSGRVAMAAGLRLGYLPQGDQLSGTVGEIVFPGGATDTPWEADPRARAIMAELLPGIGVDAQAAQLSGGERRRGPRAPPPGGGRGARPPHAPPHPPDLPG